MVDICVWSGECSRCGWGKIDEMTLYLAIGPKGIIDAQLLCKNVQLCSERQRAGS